MSYILDALQKSEQERQQQQAVPTISAAHETQLSTSSPKLTKAWWLVIGLSIVLSSILGYLVFADKKQPQNDSANRRTEITAPGKAIAPQQANQSPNIVDKTHASNPVISIAQETPIESRVQDEEKPVTRFTESKISELYRTAKETQTEPRNSTPIDLPTESITSVDLTDPVRDEVIQKQITSTNIATTKKATTEKPKEEIFPTIYELPNAVQSEIPPIQYIAHVYSSDVSKGFVILNNVKLTPGRRLQGELYLEKVGQDHIVMSFQGYLFKLPSMTNWNGRY